MREGYESESNLFKPLELINEAAGPPPAPGNDMKARIARLNLGSDGGRVGMDR
ncbi:hypothetical protein [Pseudomonas syringae group genomosp. 7]|uniref:hypothetical protein n=1 Tax=Pseudomonas syringae group genomosp. 7 TaxID=251699 RepID=UPI00376F8F6F